MFKKSCFVIVVATILLLISISPIVNSAQITRKKTNNALVNQYTEGRVSIENIIQGRHETPMWYTIILIRLSFLLI